ncbi:MAG: VF530 family DNA-binding protein [Cyclobacteriaceae bacterium]|nr:VF530 family DNA-binding protein [Cyclobacteriaceae bacterium]
MKTIKTSSANQSQTNNPLHGLTLEEILEFLVAKYGWEELGEMINIHGVSNFDRLLLYNKPKFLRKTPWARDKVEQLFIRSVGG